VKKTGPRKLTLHLETLRNLDGSALEGAKGRFEIYIQLEIDSVTCASNKRCTGCVPCVTTG